MRTVHRWPEPDATLDALVPPEYRGQTWAYRLTEYDRKGEAIDVVVHSRFPPMTVGVPGEITDAWIDFQLYQGQRLKRPHPTCRECGSGLCEPTIRAGRAVCGPCLEKRKEGQQLPDL